jgi:hypothetical protein
VLHVVQHYIQHFTEETFRQYKANLAATATVKAATGMLDDDNDVPLFD